VYVYTHVTERKVEVYCTNNMSERIDLAANHLRHQLPGVVDPWVASSESLCDCDDADSTTASTSSSYSYPHSSSTGTSTEFSVHSTATNSSSYKRPRVSMGQFTPSPLTLSLRYKHQDHQQQQPPSQPQRAQPVSNKMNTPQARQDKLNLERVQMSLPPRILKHDVRRLMPCMLRNVLNSTDAVFISSFFRLHATPHSALTMRFHNSSVDFTNLFHGRHLHTPYWLGMLRLMPDKVLDIDHPRLVTQFGSLRCRLEMDVRVYGVKLYNILLDVYLQQLLVDFEAYIASNNNNDNSDNNDNPQSRRLNVCQFTGEDCVRCPDEIETVTRQVDRFTDDYDPVRVFFKCTGVLPPLSPFLMSLQGRLVVQFDENKLIEHMDLDLTPSSS
jgi:hypothetical protein